MSFEEIWALYKPVWPVKTYVYIVVLLLAMFMICLRLSLSHKWTRQRCISAWLLGAYLIVIFTSAVFARDENLGYRYELQLFWSYSKGIAMDGKRAMTRQIIMNILMLMPVGFLQPVILGENVKKKIPCGIVTILIGFIISATIEVLQLVLKRGLFEFDDMFHNILGVALGFLIYCGARNVWNRIHRKIEFTNET